MDLHSAHDVRDACDLNFAESKRTGEQQAEGLQGGRSLESYYYLFSRKYNA